MSSLFHKRNDTMRAMHYIPDTITFSVFTSEEVRKLSVMKIVTPLTFDELGHPKKGGLYDKALGPLSSHSEPCGTCCRNVYACIGHFGHIEFPLPVTNPVFHKTVYMLLKLSCLSCFRLQVSPLMKDCLSIQMRLLDRGLTTVALDIEQKIQTLVEQSKSVKDVPEKEIVAIKEYAMQIEENSDSNEKVILNKNIEETKTACIQSKLQKRTGRQNRCIHCRNPLPKISTIKNKIALEISKATKRNTNNDPNNSLVGNIKVKESKYVNPEESRGYLQKIWANDGDFLRHFIPVLNDVNCEVPTDAFYCDVILVTPTNVRPVNHVNGKMMEHDQTQLYKEILQSSILLNVIIKVVQTDGDISVLPTEATKESYKLATGKSPIEKLNNAWENLQLNVDCLLDTDNGGRNAVGQGVKQIIEKKQGLIRQNMMGKRVNYSARSVITPDTNLNIEEIGIPEEFAKRLTYPTPVTFWNVTEMRKLVMNGPNVHPGATQVELEDGTVKRLNPNDATQRESIAKRLLTPDDKARGFTGLKRVHRHLNNGDTLLVNRQPTLHRPSIMAHTARILKGEKTLRLHYANCKAYNADFDGDEMNIHFPQNEVARSEGYTLANVANQYLVPKDGTPLSGLIQDHVISGVRMSIRGKFFTKVEYDQLVFQGVAHKTSKIILLPPAIMKPVSLWSGKQVLSTVIINIIPNGQHYINLTSTAKIAAKAWQTQPTRPWKAGGAPFRDDKAMSEAEVIIRNGELLVGVLDKMHYGATPYGLVHCMYELYGGTYATKLLSSFAKLFTYFLQWEGFTLGVRDILVLSKADKKRRKIVKESRKIGKRVITTALDIPVDTPEDEIVQKLEEACFHNPKMRSIIDREYKSALDSYTNDINKTCLPAGLISKFPQNNLQLMVQSGAKGSTVNTMQISCLLGQIELEGKRPPVMISGKSLPSFPAFEFAPRAGGFIDGRFMTGIKPQEFFFHCMAGREGLIDTAVKTSRSGYLQRCLIKHLEGLSVGYDLTVRDSDRSVIQFLYGEDGMDVSKTQFLNSKQMKFLAENSKAIINKEIIERVQGTDDKAKLDDYTAQMESWKTKHGNPLHKHHVSPFSIFSSIARNQYKHEPSKKNHLKKGRDKLTRKMLGVWQTLSDENKNAFKKECTHCPDPLNANFQPDVYYGALSDQLSSLMENYKDSKDEKEREEFENMLKFKAMRSLCDPGEPVGLLAAQSIGEPSTQMTLNTFHFAGRGEMNVTLGIPRLREILMMASKSIKTPSMEIPFLNVLNLEKKAENLRKALTRVTVADVLEKIDVTGKMETGYLRQMVYKLKFFFLPHELYKSKYNVKPKYVLKHMTKSCFKLMFMTLKKHTKIHANVVGMNKDQEENKTASRKNNDDDEDEGAESTTPAKSNPNAEKAEDGSDNSDEEPEDSEDAKLSSKYQQAHEDQDPEEEEKEASDNEENMDNSKEETAKPKGSEDEDGTGDEEEAVSVVSSYNSAQNYIYDKKSHLWCELTFALPLTHKKLDLTAILREVANKSVIWETPHIKRAITYMKDDRLTLRTDGINIIEMFKYSDLLDLDQLYSNDIHQVAETYGIEAATKVIVKEVQEVFKVYGITVDPRHLLLVADYMTFNGTFQPLNRMGLSNSASPLQQMSFEASLNFLKAATIRGKQDQLQSPSSCLMVGKPCRSGTGSHTLLHKLYYHK